MARILIVDDEPDYRMLLEHALVGWGHDTRTAGNMDGVRETLREFEPDLTIVDWMLRAESDGIDVARAVREATKSAILLITGYPARELDQLVGGEHISQVLTKPFELSTLRKAVENGVSTH